MVHIIQSWSPSLATAACSARKIHSYMYFNAMRCKNSPIIPDNERIKIVHLNEFNGNVIKVVQLRQVNMLTFRFLNILQSSTMNIPIVAEEAVS